MNIYVGTPPQKQSVILDTGSDYLAFPCSKCPKGKCGKHNNPPLDISQDSSAKPFPCGHKFGNYTCTKCKDGKCIFSRFYLEGSGLGGEVYQDNISIVDRKLEQTEENVRKLPLSKKRELKNVHKTDYKGAPGIFGCTTKESGLFKTQLANGIMGLGDATNTKSVSPNFLDSLYKAHKAKDKNFSICLGTDGGYLTFGGYNTNKHIPNEPIQTVPYKNNYLIKFANPSLNGPNKSNKSALKYEAILDSGTTYTYLQKPIWSKFVKEFNAYCTKPDPSYQGKKCGGKNKVYNDYCVHYTPSTYGSVDNFFAGFPTLNFRLDNNVNISWFPVDYMFKRKSPDNNQIFCISINKEDQNVNTYSTFGSLFMRHYDIYFNKKEHKISFVRSECEDKSIRAYPIMKIKKIVAKARILMGYIGSFITLPFMMVCMFIILSFFMYRIYKDRKNLAKNTLENRKNIISGEDSAKKTLELKLDAPRNIEEDN